MEGAGLCPAPFVFGLSEISQEACVSQRVKKGLGLPLGRT